MLHNIYTYSMKFGINRNFFCFDVTLCFWPLRWCWLKKGHYTKSHESLIATFGQVYVNQDNFDRKIAKYLARAQSLREDADYGAIDGINESIAKLWINNAEEFMKEAEKFL